MHSTSCHLEHPACTSRSLMAAQLQAFTDCPSLNLTAFSHIEPNTPQKVRGNYCLLNEVTYCVTSIRLAHISDDHIAIREVTLEPVVPCIGDEWFYYGSDVPSWKHKPKNSEKAHVAAM